MAWVKKSNIRGPRGVRGLPGPCGIAGPPGKDAIGRDGVDGRDGQDAAEIVDVKVVQIRNQISFLFKFDDGTQIRTNYIDLPISQITYTPGFVQVANNSGGGGGNTGSGGSSGDFKADGSVPLTGNLEAAQSGLAIGDSYLPFEKVFATEFYDITRLSSGHQPNDVESELAFEFSKINFNFGTEGDPSQNVVNATLGMAYYGVELQAQTLPNGHAPGVALTAASSSSHRGGDITLQPGTGSDSNGDPANGIIRANADVDLFGHTINNLLDPVEDQQAATKKYVDDKIAAIPPPTPTTGSADQILYNLTCDTSVFPGAIVRISESNFSEATIDQWPDLNTILALKSGTYTPVVINALADEYDHSNVIGLVERKTSATLCDVRITGVTAENYFGLDPNEEYYLSDTDAGKLVASFQAPSADGHVLIKIGQPVAHNKLLIARGERIVRG